MDYFFMNECIFKLLIKNQKEFILKFLESINIKIEDYDLFEMESNNNVKVDLLLFAKHLVINIQLNKNEKSLQRNRIYLECLKSLLPDYQVIQININLFKSTNQHKNIYNYFNENEYIVFLTTKEFETFKTNNNYIKNVIKQFKKSNINLYEKEITKEQIIKQRLDNLIKD